jgi:Ran GTPase-activating protein (RanGAP) involved in mRNA processing and transport
MLDLMEFMNDRDMIKKINLRRNKIGDEGAKALARFLTSNDDTLIDINLDRNRITEVGIDEILDAVHTTIRI